jgi:hypothetical protein
MDGTSSPDLVTKPFEFGMLRQVMQMANLWRGIRGLCGLLPTLPMDGTSYPDPVTEPFEFGMPRQVMQLVSL